MSGFGMKRRFDTGGQVGGQTPTTTALSSQQAPSTSAIYNNMTPEQLLTLEMRLPIGSAQQQQVSQIVQQKRMMPNVGAQATGGFGSQQQSGQPPQQPTFARGGSPRGYDAGGSLPTPPMPSQIPAYDPNDSSGMTYPGNGPPPPPAAPGGMGTQKAPQVTSSSPEDSSDMASPVEHRSPNPWISLAAAGFGMAAGTSPQAGVNIGRGALEGIQNYTNQQKEADTVNDAADKLMAEAKIHKEQIAIDQQKADQEGKYQTGELGIHQQQLDQGNYEVSRNPVTGETNIFNKKTGAWTSPPKAGSQTGQPQSGSFIDPDTGDLVQGMATAPPAFGGSATTNMPPAVYHAMATEDSKQRQAAVNNMPLANNILSTLDTMEPNYSQVDTGGYGSPIERAGAKLFNPNGQYNTSAANLDKGTMALATDLNKFQYTPGQRGSVLGLQTILASKPGMDQPQQTNENITADIRSRVNDYQLTQNLAQQWRQASPLKITDSETYAVDDALKKIYPLQTVDPKTGVVTFNKENVDKIKQAIPDAISNPKKYLNMASQGTSGSQESAPQTIRVRGPNGQTGMMSPAELPDAIKNGWQQVQ